MFASRWAACLLLFWLGVVLASPIAMADEAANNAAAKLAAEKLAADKARTVQWSQKLRIWRTWYMPGSDDPAQTREAARELIAAIDDPLAIPAICALLKTEKYSQFRRALIQPLIALGGEEAVATLVRLSVEDDNAVLRQEAAEGLAGKPELAQHLDKYIAYLYKPQFSAAAAVALRQNGLAVRQSNTDPLNEKLAKGLIAALVQKQKKLVPYWMAFDTGITDGWEQGTFDYLRTKGIRPSGAPMPRGGRFAEYKEGWTEALVPQPNEEALQTLKNYSYQDYEYDQKQWTEKLITGAKR